MGWDNFWLAITGEALHGFGSGSVVVAMRTVVSQFFLQNELTFAHVRNVRYCVRSRMFCFLESRVCQRARDK